MHEIRVTVPEGRAKDVVDLFVRETTPEDVIS
jgi:hypothetical protein